MTRTLALITLSLVLAACSSSGREFSRDLGRAATAPLDDLNLRREEIPEVLQRAAVAPYAVAGLNRCIDVALEVRALNEALGPDQDEPPRPDRPLSDEAMDALAEAALDAIASETRSFIPARDWVRRLSGAEQHSRRVQAAIQAGRARRAFLKGYGMQRNCAPPAAPSWFTPRPEPERRRGFRWPWEG